ncbi:MAG: hypothetical protein R3B93_27545 [Bacteroidia bacterium]
MSLKTVLKPIIHKTQDNLATETDKRTILFFGNSLTAGYGLMILISLLFL